MFYYLVRLFILVIQLNNILILNRFYLILNIKKYKYYCIEYHKRDSIFTFCSIITLLSHSTILFYYDIFIRQVVWAI